MTQKILLTQGKYALVDDADFLRLMKHTWTALNKKGRWYAVTMVNVAGKQATVYMHRAILNESNPKVLVDHADNDGLNNQRRNLRRATPAQNSQNRRKPANNKTGLKGVMWDRQKQKYKAQIRADGTQKHLGYFTDPEEAARAYDQAAKELHGEFARLNGV